jgi:hypothetical protein
MKRCAFAVALVAACSPAEGTAVTPEATPAPVAERCGKDPYIAAPAWSGPSPALPVPPVIPPSPEKIGEAYTVRGAIHLLRARTPSPVLQEDIRVVGYIVDTNLARAPKCLLHPVGKQTPAGCIDGPNFSAGEAPRFMIADDNGASAGPRIIVSSWARNFAVVFDALRAYGKSADPPHERQFDDILGVAVPFPLPAIGAKVEVTGRYQSGFGASERATFDPPNGVLIYHSMITLERAPTPAAFPQLAP